MGKKKKAIAKEKAIAAEALQAAVTEKVPYGAPFILFWVEDGKLHMDARCSVEVLQVAQVNITQYLENLDDNG